MGIRKNCRFFRGDQPCTFHKKKKATCPCGYFQPMGFKILIIKIRGIGDVIRTTPIVERLKREYPESHISWLTETPEILPSQVDEPIRFENKSIPLVFSQEFDLLLNFDKDKDSCALASIIKAKRKKGFILEGGKRVPADADALPYFKWGIDDTLNKKSKESYQQLIFRTAGLTFEKEPYAFNFSFDTSKKLVGLNTGCGERWRTRLWSEEKWIELANILKNDNYEVLLLGGGGSEDEKNGRIALCTGALYFGAQTLKNFIAFVGFCDAIVTTVTMALHTAIALKKKVVVLNNIFNKHELELYGLGEIIEPNVQCSGCYKEWCEEKCMDTISPKSVFNTLKEVLRR